MRDALHLGSYEPALQTYWVQTVSARCLPILLDSCNLDHVVHENQNPAAWKRLGKMLTERRVALGWFRRSSFVEAHADRLSNDRTIAALEKNERMNYSRETLALVEILYQWKPGSIDNVLAGGDPWPVEDVTVTYDPAPAISFQRMECRFIIDRLDENQLADALRMLRDMESPER